MQNIVLVHGAWGSAASWSSVAGHLRGAGCSVSVPSLTGLGERRHLFSGQITLSTHIADVVGQIEAEGLEDFVLVGHSYAGMVITAAADRLADRIRSLVYLDAFVPGNGQSAFDLLGPETTLANLSQAGEQGGVGVPPPERHTARIPEKMRFHLKMRSPQPLATLVERVRLTGAHEKITRRHYVAAVIDQAPVFKRAYEMVRANGRWTHEEIDTGHMLHLERPGETARMILKVANASGNGDG